MNQIPVYSRVRSMLFVLLELVRRLLYLLDRRHMRSEETAEVQAFQKCVTVTASETTTNI